MGSFKKTLLGSLFCETWVFFRNAWISFKNDFSSSKELSSLYRDGFFSMADFLSQEKCEEIREKIDACLDSDDLNVWRDEEGADERIYFAESADPVFQELLDNKYIDMHMKQYTGYKNPVGMVLASRLSNVKGNKGSGGGWHRDSAFVHQFKALFYLSDVGEESGPFQFIEHSHKFKTICRALISGLLKPSQFRFLNKQIDTFCLKTNLHKKTLLGKAGSLALLDTKLIHRGKPIEEKSRYVVFLYFWDRVIPRHFEPHRQSQRPSV